MRIIDSRTLEQIYKDGMSHASQVAIKHATGYFTRQCGSVVYDNAFCAGNYARIAAHNARLLHPEVSK